MSDFPSSPGVQAQDEPASSSSNGATTSAFALQPVYGRSHRLQSRGSSRGASPSPSSRATSRVEEENAAQIYGERVSEMADLQRSQLAMVAMMEQNLHTNLQLLASMTTSQDEYRRDLEERFRLFSQNVQAPIIQAVTTSTDTFQATSAMAGAVMNLRADLARTLYEAEEANRVAELQQTEAQQQALQSAHDLILAQDALTRHHGEATARGAPTEDSQRPAIASEFGPRSNAFSPPASVRFAAPDMADSRTQDHHEPPRMRYLERPQVQTSSFGPIGMSIDQPGYQTKVLRLLSFNAPQ